MVIATLIERGEEAALELDQGRGKADGVLKILDKFVVNRETREKDIPCTYRRAGFWYIFCLA